VALVAGSVGVAEAQSTPPGRGYELVSPAEKAGGYAIADSSRTHAAADGNRAAFTSVNGFADVRGMGASTEYVSVRTAAPGTQGWATHAITPRQDPLTTFAVSLGLEPAYQAFSDDLSHAVFQAWSPLTDAPNVAQVENFYLRNNILTPGAGDYQLLSDAVTPLGLGALFAKPQFAGASSDYGHVIFETYNPLTADPVAGDNLYEWDHGTLRLASVLPNGDVAPSSIAGQGAQNNRYTPDTISNDGSHIFFTVPQTTCFAVASSFACGDLYVRVNHTSTVQLNASERTDCADHDPCNGTLEPDPGGPQPAGYWDASTDGSVAFLTTQEQLTNDDHNNTYDLYRWDESAPVGHHLTRLSVDEHGNDFDGNVQGVIGASDDGSYVYFIARDPLIATQTVSIYLSHAGHVTHIGQLANAEDADVDLNPAWSLKRRDAQVTPDGRHLLFSATDGTGLTGYDHSHVCSPARTLPCVELYVYSADSDHLACASCNPSGAPATADAADHIAAFNGFAAPTSHASRALSDDGRYVFFSTREALVHEDVNGKSDAYEYDTTTGEDHLISTGTSTSDSYFLDASASGSDVFFATNQELVGWDMDANFDLYDARTGGGLPDPATTPPSCSGDSCQGPPAAKPNDPTIASGLITGPGNHGKTTKPRTTPPRCKHGYVHKHTKHKTICVKKRKPHTKPTGRTTSRDRVSVNTRRPR
jgi:hypothetical protein